MIAPTIFTRSVVQKQFRGVVRGGIIIAFRGHKVTLHVPHMDKGDVLNGPDDPANSTNLKRWGTRTYVHPIKVSLSDVSTGARAVKKCWSDLVSVRPLTSAVLVTLQKLLLETSGACGIPFTTHVG